MARLSMPKGKQSFSNFLRKALNLSPIAIGLLQEAARASKMSLSSLSAADLANWINAVPIKLNDVAPIARAISSAGGISFSEIDADYMIRRLPGVFAAGDAANRMQNATLASASGVMAGAAAYQSLVFPSPN